MNPLDPKLVTGTTGELLVQLRLFQYGVQAAPPLKDSGNDLIAVRGSTFRAVQVKTTRGQIEAKHLDLSRDYHILALVVLHGEDQELYLDKCEIYLLDRRVVEDRRCDLNDLSRYRLTRETVDELFPDPRGV